MINEIKKIKDLKILENVDLEKYTSYKLTGVAKALVYPENTKALINILKYLRENNYKYKIIGGGSNLIFESNYDGILIKLDYLNELKIDDTLIKVGAGYNTMALALKVSRMGLTGMEFATGIPGTIGGAIINNSGAYKSDMGYIVESVIVLTPSYEIKTMYNKELNYHYRDSFFKHNPGYVVLEARIVLKHGEEKEIIEVIEDRKKRRLMSQPLEYPSAGSVFRNPPDNFAGKLIEDIGYKGKIINGAQVSEKHANFIININHAKGEDIIKLITQIQEEVKRKYNINLILEQEIVR